MNRQRRDFNRMALALAGMASAPRLFAQSDPAADYPSHPIHVIVPFAPGGGTDIVARVIGQKLGEAWKQPVVIENKAGGNGTIGAAYVAKSPPDGYTLSMITASHSVNVTLQGAKHPYDLLKDFAPISQVTTQPYYLVVNPKLPVRSVKELIDLARSKPGKLTYGSSGVGGTSHLSGALFCSLANIDMTHVPYRGGEPAMADVISGQIDMLFSTRLQSRGFVEQGQLRALAVTTAKRSPATPELPTMEEAGVPGYVVAGWYGVLAPAGTPPAIVNKLNREIVRIVHLPDVAEKMATDGSEPVGSSPAQFAAHIKSEVEKWRDLIHKTGIKTES
ncbi:MAG TPA: tripartite tricarboxylate transporter substrate binding protein [Casimicrobiaceae bacterium]|jgi:tripartite-type tricarboxylate transporter receptor subunit TctC|nr:tripartite tricarboxylate transporter substrate binding protein [Casimicrobiaceae bacterium]